MTILFAVTAVSLLVLPMHCCGVAFATCRPCAGLAQLITASDFKWQQLISRLLSLVFSLRCAPLPATRPQYKYPLAAASCGAVYLLGRILYFNGRFHVPACMDWLSTKYAGMNLCWHGHGVSGADCRAALHPHAPACSLLA